MYHSSATSEGIYSIFINGIINTFCLLVFSKHTQQRQCYIYVCYLDLPDSPLYFITIEIMKKTQISSLTQSANSTIQNILYIHLSLFYPTFKFLFT